MKIKLTVNCCLCETDHRTEVELPDGWAHRYGGVDDENAGFCPKHAAVAAFAEAQCPGCVGGWGDCPMWDAFAYAGRRRNVGAGDFDKLARGICPRRVNGTLSVSGRGVEEMNISDRAPPEAGAAFAQAIRDYCERYPER